MSVTEYLKRKDLYQNALFVISPKGIGYFKVNGAKLSRLEFERLYQLPASLIVNASENSDKTKDWLRP